MTTHTISSSYQAAARANLSVNPSAQGVQSVNSNFEFNTAPNAARDDYFTVTLTQWQRCTVAMPAAAGALDLSAAACGTITTRAITSHESALFTQSLWLSGTV